MELEGDEEWMWVFPVASEQRSSSDGAGCVREIRVKGKKGSLFACLLCMQVCWSKTLDLSSRLNAEGMATKENCVKTKENSGRQNISKSKKN